MAAEIIPFDFETNAVRVVLMDQAPWFAAVDVCRVLDHKNPTVALNRLDQDEKQVIDPKLWLGSSVAGGGAQMMNVVSESGLYALILTSNKPAAKRFRKWVTAEVLPAIRRQGFYMAPPADLAEIEAKRVYFKTLPEAHRERAEAHADAVRQVENLIAAGSRVGAAVAEVAAERGVSARSLYSWRRTVYMVPGADHGAALAPRWSGERGMLAECHAEALRFYLDLVASGARPSHALRRTREVAAEQGWVLPTDRTLRRLSAKALPRPTPSKKEAA